MTLTDTGPLIALIDANDPNHELCTSAARRLPNEPLLTTWPCFTEAMYFVGKEGGHRAQQRLWALRRAHTLMLHEVTDAMAERMEALMAEYADAPMDLADASLVVTAEVLGLSRILTVDRHFRAYRLGDAGAFEVIP